MPQRVSTLVAPRGRWLQPLGRDERLWITITLFWAVAMFIFMMFIWPRIGHQQAMMESWEIEPAAFHERTEQFIQQNTIGERDGMPLVAPAPGSDVYIEASRFQFRPAIQLKRGETYRLLLSSRDVQHGFSLNPGDFNLQVLPGYIIAVELTPQEAGEYSAVCNEYCGLGHHVMLGHITVVD